jgi:hypothetical protein
MAQVVLAWLRYRPVPVTPVIVARSFPSCRKPGELQHDALGGPIEDTDDASQIDISFLQGTFMHGT